MKIVVLDGFTLNPGDLSWEGVEALGECTVYDRTEKPDIVERSQNADLVLTNKTPLYRETIEQLPKLKYIGVLATGYNIIDVDAATAANITVTNVPAYSTVSVAQTVFAHVLNLCHHVSEHSIGVKEHLEWSRSDDFCFWSFPLIELAGLTLGIIGPGQTGQAVAKLAEAFGMNVIAYHPNASSRSFDLTMVDLDTLFKTSDIVSLHCPLTPETRSLVNAERLEMMKPSAFIINTSRGPVIDEDALARALNTGEIAGAGLDVLSKEPPLPDNPLFHARNCFITPHIAWATLSARQRLMKAATDNVEAFLRGAPQNVVNPD